jgi:MHS family shikimate/dehydroshikimate transporter-like MFS transporter
MMMGIGTVLIGLLPTYATIGAAAPILLVVLRIVQGIGVGGEYGSATVLVIEHANESGRRGFFGAIVTSGASAGFLLASGLVALLTGVMSSEAFLAWGWRIPFLCSAVPLFVGMYVRLNIAEPPVMESAIQSNATVRVPLLEVFRTAPKQALLAFLVPVGRSCPTT